MNKPVSAIVSINGEYVFSIPKSDICEKCQSEIKEKFIEIKSGRRSTKALKKIKYCLCTKISIESTVLEV